MRCSERLAIDHRQPIRGYFSGGHTGSVYISRIHPESKFQACRVDVVRQGFYSVWKLLFVFLIAAESKRPIIHSRDHRGSLVPRSIVIEDIEADSLRQAEFLQQYFLAVLLRKPDAIGN